MTHRPDPPLTDATTNVRISLTGETPQGAIQASQTIKSTEHLERLTDLLQMFNIEREKRPSDAAPDVYEMAAFIDNPRNRRVLMNGSDISRMAWRILKKLQYDHRDERREKERWKALYEAATGTSETKHVDRLEQRR